MEKLDNYTYGYITFLLGADNFAVCKKIRNTANEFGMDGIYEDCSYIAKKFMEYDKRNYNTMSEYQSFEMFVKEYEQQIMDFIENKKEIIIGGAE